ncbi:MAG: type II secretion system F family protein [Actinobacteria bacterium]|nr:type II secretion system F family protein [Actinomycetota bacterium]
MSPHGWGALLGLVTAIGLLLVGSWLRARRPLTVAERVGPFVRGASGGRPVARRRAPESAWATLWLLARPTGPSLRAPVRGPRPATGDRDRLPQATWTLLGAAAGAAAGLLLTVGGSSPIGVPVLAASGAAMGALAHDRVRARQVRRRRERIDQQLPNVAELLAFAVAAGESPVAALERVAGVSAGDLSEELAAAIADIRSGDPLADALLAVGQRAGTPAVQRFVEGIVVSMERGTPLSDVMRAQAADCRADERRRLMETAGRKDVLMLVPVVFLILPTVVLVALFPGIQGLRMVIA